MEKDIEKLKFCKRSEELDHLSDDEVNEMLSKYGPEGLYQIAVNI